MSIGVEVAIGAEPGTRYDGPFDVLLAIVRRGGYPLDQLPLGEITRQFTGYVEQHQADFERDDLELGAGFFETASWLVLLKSRALLAGGDEQEAPAEELRRALEAREIARDEIRKYSGWLAAGLDQVGIDPGRTQSADSSADEAAMAQAPLPDRDNEPREEAPTVHDAVLAARHALAIARAHGAAAAEAEAGAAISMADVLAALDHRLAQLPRGVIVSTAPWFAALAGESGAVLLLALLELARLGELWLYQAAPGTTVWIQRPRVFTTGEPKKKQNDRSTQRP